MTYKEKITITYENDGKVYTASYEGAPINRQEALKWFEFHALGAIGFALEGGKVMTNDGKKDSKLDDMSEEIAAIHRLHSECPHILDWKDTTGFTIPILNVAVALADYALGKDARIAELSEALREILCCHDGNQPDALNMPDLAYARRTIATIHRLARAALAPRGADGKGE